MTSVSRAGDCVEGVGGVVTPIMPERFVSRVFLLSPASLSGRRAALLFNPDASFDLAVRIRAAGVPLGEVFSFISGLYFRGKVTYARRFSGPGDAVRIIT
ncbi:MAG: hypothetical protein ACREK8_01085, partial [Gemmatimonadales bacterium]